MGAHAVQPGPWLHGFGTDAAPRQGPRHGSLSQGGQPRTAALGCLVSDARLPVLVESSIIGGVMQLLDSDHQSCRTPQIFQGIVFAEFGVKDVDHD